MLEQNEQEHTSDEAEHDINTENNSEEQLKSNNNTAQQDLELPGDEASRSPCPSDEQEGSIYIVSSGEDSNHAYNDDEEEYTDSEGMDDMENSLGMMDDDEDEDDGMSDPLRLYEDDIDDNETEYEQDTFDRASDNFILNNRLTQHYKERSLSLQDLNISKQNLHSPQKKKWHNNFNLQLNKNALRAEHCAIYKRQIMMHKDDYMDNKVINYLRDVREQNKTMKNEYTKEQEFVTNKDDGNEDNNIKQVKTKLRDPATENCGKEISKDLQQHETTESNQNNLQIPGNKISNGMSEDRYKHTQENIEYNNTYNEKDMQNCDNIEKRNGSLNVSAHVNYNNVEIDAQTIENSDTNCLKIMSIKSIADEAECANSTKDKLVNKVNTENTELNGEVQSHQKAGKEDTQVKLELNSLRNLWATYEGKSKTCEMKSTLQTEAIMDVSNKDTVTSKERKNIVTISNGESAVRSTDNWVEGVYSPVRSTESREINVNLNSDKGDNSEKTVNSVLRTCIMSSTYSETLAMPGKARIENSSAVVKKELNGNHTDDQSQDQSLRMNSAAGTSNPRKRKAAEILDDSSFVQASKISCTERNKIDAHKFKYPEIHTTSKAKQETNNASTSRSLNSSVPVQNTMEHVDENEGNVKCFIYRDDNNSKNRSFLIQTEETVKGTESEKNRIEECGPYILGNLEIRMSKINGVISVWGKEIDNESQSDSEDDIEISVTPSERNTCCCQHKWQGRSNSRGASMCSTNKAQRIPAKSNRCSHCNLPLKSSTFISDMNDHQSKHLHSLHPTTSHGNCSSSYCQEHEWPLCKDAARSREQVHSSCMYHTETINRSCDCSSYHKKQTFNVNSKCCADKLHTVGVHRHVCKNVCTTNSFANCTCDKCNQNVLYENEEVPSIPCRRANETAEMRQQRLRRKRVEEVIKSLLDEYGDHHDNTSVKRNEAKDSSHVAHDSSQAKTSSESARFTRMQSDDSCRCRHSRTRSLESEIKELQTGMNRIESRLDTIVKLLNKLRYVDIN